MTETINTRFDEINQKIGLACRLSGRNRKEVTLIVVTKGQPAEKIIEVYKAGARILGENYPQDTIEKITEIKNEINPIWHMIGHLQSRKIKLMYPYFSMIHSIDSLELAQKVHRFYMERDASIEVLIEVNIAGEESKNGFMATTQNQRDYLYKAFEQLISLNKLKIRGLMTMPPPSSRSEQNKPFFDGCRELLFSIQKEFGIIGFDQISMGTSADYYDAIMCGSTLVRVGEAVMGKRSIKVSQ